MKAFVLGTFLLQALTTHVQAVAQGVAPRQQIPGTNPGPDFTPGPNGPFPPIYDDEEGVGMYDGEDYGDNPYKGKAPKGKGPEECPAWCKPTSDAPDDMDDDMLDDMLDDEPPMMQMKGPAPPPPPFARRDSAVQVDDEAWDLNRAPAAPTPSTLKGFQFPKSKKAANANAPANGPAAEDDDDDIPAWLANTKSKSTTKKTGKSRKMCPAHCLTPPTTTPGYPFPTHKGKKGKSSYMPYPTPTTIHTVPKPQFTGGVIANMCPTSCDPFNPAQNKCDSTTSCSTTGGKNFMCACRAGFRVDGFNAKDFVRQAKIPGMPYVYAQAGLPCNTVCSDQTCSEVLERPKCK